MEDIFFFDRTGRCKYSYQRDGSTSTLDIAQLWAGSSKFMKYVPTRHCMTSTNQKDKKQKMICFYPTANESLFIFITTEDYAERAIYSFLRSQDIMAKAFFGSFTRPIHRDGMHLHNIFGMPRVYPRREDQTTKNLMNELVGAVNSPACVLYAQNMIIAASPLYWKLSPRDIHAIDLLVRHNEAPFTDQMFTRDKTQNIERALIFHVYKSMKFVCLNGRAFDAMKAASEDLPRIFHKYGDYLRQLESAPPVTNKIDGIVGWVVHDLATPRFFGHVPEEYEHQFVNMICKCYDIRDRNIAITDISFRLSDHKFFYMPRVFLKKTFYFQDPHFWDIFILHDLQKDEMDMRKFAKDTMLSLLQFVPPINPVTQEVKENPNVHDED